MTRPLRNRAYLFGLGVVTALMAVGMAFLLIGQFAQRERVQNALDRRVDSVPALVFQHEREFLRLRRTLEVGLRSPQGPDMNDLTLRYDIFLSRLVLLRDNPSIALLQDRPEYRKVMPLLEAWAVAAERTFGRPNLERQELADLLARMDAMGPDIQALSMAANSVVSSQVEDQGAAMLRQSDLILWLTLGQLVLLLISSVALVLRQRRQERELRATEQLNAELLEARQKADAANRAKGQFLAHMSHELRTPFNGILGMLDLLAATPVNAQQADYVTTAQTSANHLLALLNDILDVSSLDEGSLVLNPAPAALGPLLRDLEQFTAPAAQAKGLTLALELPDQPLPAVVVDAPRLTQILLNLLQNAVKFTASGSVRLQVGCQSVDAARVSLKFAVVDSGIGIAAEDLPKLFRRFTQLDDKVDRRADGTGLGLEISQTLARMMGGDIVVQSNPGQGSVFTFSVVLEQAPADQVRPAADAVQALKPVPSETVAAPGMYVGLMAKSDEPQPLSASPDVDAAPESPHVLVVEDNPINQKLAVVLLQKMGCTVDCCTNGRDAVERVQQDRFALVLMDVNMPIMDGLTATRLIRALEGPVALIPVVVLTADTMNEARANAMAAGANEFLGKPVQMRVLYDHLKRFIPVHL